MGAKRIVLIDGENFVHKIVESLEEQGLVRGRKDVTRFDVVGLLEEVLGTTLRKSDVVNYYATKVKIVKTPAALRKRTSDIVAWNARWVPYISNQGVHYIKSGNLQVRDTKRCVRCGHTSLALQEKGVDVRLAVDILLAKEKYSEIVVVSSDSDLAPAIRAAKGEGQRLVYVGFEFGVNIALVSETSITRTITAAQIAGAFQRVQSKHGK